ncbi:MAG: Rha family transcriptional regulator [Methylotetracoccus sp.]
MNQIVPALPDVQLVGGIPKTTSINIARVFGKRHTEVLRSANGLDCSEEFRQRNFASANYLDAQGKPRPMVEMTRDGFTFLVMGFTGQSAARWKETYIGLFNRLAEEVSRLKSHAAPAPDELAEMRAVNELLRAELANAAEKIDLLRFKANTLETQARPKPKKRAPVPVTPEKRALIVSLLGQGLGRTEIGRRVGVSPSAVYVIVRELRAGGAA